MRTDIWNRSARTCQSVCSCRYQAHDEQLYRDVEGVLELLAEACTLLHRAEQRLHLSCLGTAVLQQVSQLPTDCCRS